MEEHKYIHKVNYYETDRMGITHHSNYVRWMEEARVDFLEKIGWSFDKLEEMGITSPVLKVECEFKRTSTFADEILIAVKVKEYNGLRLKIHYEMYNAKTNEKVAICDSEHCFINPSGKIMRIKTECSEFDKALTACI